MNTERSACNREREVEVFNGWALLPLVILVLLGGIALLIFGIAYGERHGGVPLWTSVIMGLLMIPTGIIMMVGFFTLEPNEARVLILFGAYRGTVRKGGFHWGNPFYSNGSRTSELAAGTGTSGEGGVRRAGQRGGGGRHKISLRARNLNGEKLKVNDKRGNPIEIAAVVVWRVQDTAQASFDVDDYKNYVMVQSESAVRHLASCYAYDHGEENETTLRSGVDEVSHALLKELQARLSKAGVVVEEARLTHLAYAPEIAQAMLRRQQAEAVIAARQKIVHGAVSMVEMALKDLAEKQVVALDDERKAAMVSNLMVVLCSESQVNPIVNTGTLYT
ncbi:MAG TPA: SPFH domain-containing protein [Candidatus Paceibacterota bacterium]|nr:SPFH domain-containing protein [Verrucomicrobiota bacterium]HRY48926.1 SPFH domain-containing protein [Candidatus Paceibacterota bacterium]HRZ99138.1 SPFH domain-containing protein [Candidatus Paceibacterota bacterium]